MQHTPHVMTALEEMLRMMEIHTVGGVHWKRGESLCLLVCLLFSLFVMLVHIFEFLPILHMFV